MTDEQKQLIVKLGQLAKFKQLLPYYTKPSAGIPKADLAQAVQDSLTLADTALQPTDLTTLNGKVAALEALIESDSDGAINKFNEIVSFLANITDAQTLDGILGGINTSIAGKIAKVANATSGNLPVLDANGELTDSGVKPADFKTKQTAVADPAADGTGTQFIDSVSQDTNGVVTLHKKTVQSASASQPGLMSAAHYEKVEAIAYATDTDIESIFA
jgi:hypothetical protein